MPDSTLSCATTITCTIMSKVSSRATHSPQSHAVSATVVSGHMEAGTLAPTSNPLQLTSMYFDTLLVTCVSKDRSHCHHITKCFGQHHPCKYRDLWFKSTPAPEHNRVLTSKSQRTKLGPNTSPLELEHTVQELRAEHCPLKIFQKQTQEAESTLYHNQALKVIKQDLNNHPKVSNFKD